MKLPKELLSILVLLLLGHYASAQTCHSLTFEHLDGNQVNARIYNGADMFWDMESRPKYEVPKGGLNHAAFSSSLWIGGLDANGGLRVAANTYRQQGIDFFPGPHRWTGNYDCGNTTQPATNPLDVVALADGRVVFVNITGIEVYDPVAGTNTTYTYPSLRTYARALQLQDGRLMIYGDQNYPAQVPIYLMDTSTFNITVSSTLTNWHGLSQVVQLQNGEVLFAGVFGSDRYDPATGNVIATTTMNSPRIRGAAALLPNGQVLVAGGSANLSGSNPMSSTELYDPATNSWANGPTMTAGRLECKITDLGTGELLVSGGNATTGAMENYNIASNTLSVAATIGPRFIRHHTALLPNGDVAIACEETSNDAIDFFIYTPGQNAVEEANMSGIGFGADGTILPNGNFFVEISLNYTQLLFMEIDAETLRPADQRWQQVWKLNQADVDQFRQDFLNNTVNMANYPVIADWPAHGDPALGEDYYLAPFVDMDLDGVYDPVNDGDYPCVEGDQALWWVFNDAAGPHTETGGDKLGLQVKAMAYVYDCQAQPCSHTSLDVSTFYHYEITNKSANDYTDVYVGIWMDTDIGEFSDDYIGCDTARGIGFAFNGDAQDGNYGLNPPALGMMMLETPGNPKMTNYMYYENDFSVRGNPQAADDYYEYLQSKWKDGTQLTVGGNGYGGTTPTNFMYPGDAGWCGGGVSGWTEVSEGNQPFDRRMLQSFGPFSLDRGESVSLDYVLIWARAFFNDNLGAVCELQTAADSIQSWYSGQDHGCFNVITERPKPRAEVVGFDLFPNPSAGNVALELEVAYQNDVQIGIYDQFGRKVGMQNLPGGVTKLNLETADLPNGVYVVQIEGNTPQARKLVIQH